VTRTGIRSQPGTHGQRRLAGAAGIARRHAGRRAGCTSSGNHSGVPDIDPARTGLLIHGLVKRPLIFSVDALLRYPR